MHTVTDMEWERVDQCENALIRVNAVLDDALLAETETDENKIKLLVEANITLCSCS